MTGPAQQDGNLNERRKRLLYRCWHRGTREMDLILGRFADAHIANLTDEELDDFEHLIGLPDPDIYAALIGEGSIPLQFAGGIFLRIKNFSITGQGV